MICMDDKIPTWKKHGFKSRIEYEEYLIKQRGFKSYHKYREYMFKQKAKKDACEFLQIKVSENVDPDSLFAKEHIDFLRKITGCEIPLKKKKIKK